MTAPCITCGRPTPDGYACTADTYGLAQRLTAAAGHAEDAEAVLSRQARYGPGGRAGSGEGLTPDLTKAATHHRIANTIGGWARIVTEETGRRPKWRTAAGPLCPPTGGRCAHDSCETIRRRTAPPALALEAAWLSTQVPWLAKHPAAAEAFPELHRACDELARLVDRPAEKELVGMCDCGKVLYAPRHKAVITCPGPTCKLQWDVAESRDILRRALDDKLVTADHAARLGQYLDTDRTQEQIRKLINKWASRGELARHDLHGEDAFRFGDVAQRLARAPRRTQRAA